jgi:tetratricopeptide (TPR) repeat protein
MKPKLPILLILVALAAPAAHAAVDPFYQGLLRDGQYAFDRKDYATASRYLRLSCFGMLDEPRQLAGCLTRLALAQDAAGDVEEFRETFRRLVEVEDRFKGYSQGEVAPELRSALEVRLAARIPAATLAAAPAFRSTQQGKTAAAPANKPEPSRPEPVKTEPVKTEPARTAPAVTPVKTDPVKPAPSAAPAKPLSDADRQKLEQARQLLGDQRTAKELRQAFELARGVADAHPDSKEAQLLAAEGAYRISRWKEASTYFQRGGDPGEDQPERLFYMAVTLYESGDRAGAATFLKRSLPNLKRTSYVDGYAKKILGQ